MLNSPTKSGRSTPHLFVTAIQGASPVTDTKQTHRLSDLSIDDGARDVESGRRWLPIVVAIAVIVIASVTFSVMRGSKSVSVTTATARAAETGASATVLNASGYVEPRRRATVASKITGRVTEVLVDEGMRVEIRPGARAPRRRRRAPPDRRHPSQPRRRSGLSRRDQGQPRRRREKRSDGPRKLHEDGVASEQDLDSATAAVDALGAQLTVAQRNLDAAEAQLAVAVQDLENYTIRAPFAGIAVSKEAQPGEMVAPVFAGGGGISTIVDMMSLEIEVDVNESYIARVAPGQPAEAILDAYPGWRIPATVRTIIPTADRQKATVKVRLTFDELDPRILPDMGVKVAFRETAEEIDDAPRALVYRSASSRHRGRRPPGGLPGQRRDRRASGGERSGANWAATSRFSPVFRPEISWLSSPPRSSRTDRRSRFRADRLPY